MSTLPSVDTTGGVVHSFVAEVSPPVLEYVLDCGDAKHEDDRQHGYLLAECVNCRNPVEKDNEQEVEVGKSMKLLKQIFRQERENGVLGSPRFGCCWNGVCYALEWTKRTELGSKKEGGGDT